MAHSDRIRAWHSPAAALTASRNVAEKLATLTLGRLVVSRPVEGWRERRWHRHPALPPPRVRAALVAHAYYPELVPDVLRCHHWFPAGSPLHVTTTEEQSAAVGAALRVWTSACQAGVHLHVLPNRGRDIAPFLHVLATGHLGEVDAVLKLHTKRSTHLLDGDIRRRLLFLALAGGPVRVHRILTLFKTASTGLVGWSPSFRTGRTFWQRNEPRGRQLISAMGGPDHMPLGFFEGSMFWFRPAAIARVTALGLTSDDFDPEAGQTDGTLHHAVERMFAIAAALDGFSTLGTSGTVLWPRAAAPESPQANRV